MTQFKARIIDNGTTVHSSTDKKLPTPKRSQPVTKTVEIVQQVEVAKVEKNALECEICSLVMATQLEFFRHLKLHYEPAELMNAIQKPVVKVEAAKEQIVTPAKENTPEPSVTVAATVTKERSKQRQRVSAVFIISFVMNLKILVYFICIYIVYQNFQTIMCSPCYNLLIK